VQFLTSSVVVAELQISTSSKVGRGRDTPSPYMYRASAVFSTFSRVGNYHGGLNNWQIRVNSEQQYFLLAALSLKVDSI